MALTPYTPVVNDLVEFQQDSCEASQKVCLIKSVRIRRETWVVSMGLPNDS